MGAHVAALKSLLVDEELVLKCRKAQLTCCRDRKKRGFIGRGRGEVSIGATEVQGINDAAWH